ncbi:MAG: hypothetical protein LBU18_06140 [Treponema sp.]|jgi:hypothetical protein|nr:hypothetical protein [Treponema sp.]
MLFEIMLFGSMFFLSCAQDSVFYTIQYDKVLNKNAVVPGSPGKIIELGDALYVGSNAVYEYKQITGEASRWQKMPEQPGGKRIMDLAATDDGPDNKYLYALVDRGVDLSDARLYRKKVSDSEVPWEEVAKPGGNIQGLWGAGDALFAVVWDGNSVLYVMGPGETSFGQVVGVSGMLRAAAKFAGRYYAAIEGTGLLAAETADGLGTPAVSYGGDTPTDFVGLVEIGDNLIAVSSSGLIWRIDSNSLVIESKKFDVSFNGAVAKWKNPDPNPNDDKILYYPYLLLLGRAVSGGSSSAAYEYGYRELPITFSGEKLFDVDLQSPGNTGAGAPSSASNNDSYYSTLGTHPVTSLYQAPWDGVLFASSQKNGLWSCRKGNDPKEWNIE